MFVQEGHLVAYNRITSVRTMHNQGKGWNEDRRKQRKIKRAERRGK
jgi:hypothetical protein